MSAATQHYIHAAATASTNTPIPTSAPRSRHHSPVSDPSPQHPTTIDAPTRQPKHHLDMDPAAAAASASTTTTSQQAQLPSTSDASQQTPHHAMPSSSTPHPSYAGPSSAATRSSAQQLRLPTAAQRRRARELATVLLTLATCHGCNRPVHDPVTLPCGHSSCLQCIKHRVLPSSIPAEDEVTPLPCLTHLPPRLPLSPMTVPCPAHACPRSAIGRGIGAWAGHQPRYGLIPTYTERLPTAADDVGPGSPPVDGFVMGVADHPLRLTVIGPQTRSRAHLFAVPPQGVESSTSAAGAHHAQQAATLLPSLATSNLLRTDVTLSKAVAILRRYASSPLPRPPRRSTTTSSTTSTHARSARSGSSRRAHPSLQSAGASVRRARVAQGRRSQTARTAAARSLPAASSSAARRTHRPSSSNAGMGIFGGNESDLESGTVGGVAAAAESDDGEASSLEDSQDSNAETSHDTVHAAATDDERTEEEDDRLWPDHVGGAFSRPPLVSHAARKRGKARLKRRRGRRSDDSTSSAASFRKAHAPHIEGKLAKRQSDLLEDSAVGHVDSGWTTEDSSASPALNRGSGEEDMVDSLRRRRAHLHRATSSTTDAETDGDTTDHAHNQRAVEAKHSLALSSKCGLNGEPLIQTVATLHSELVEVLECQLCYLLLYDPLTTPCGHTFCKSCFARSLDHGDRCPLCRADMPNFSFFQDHRANTALLKVLQSDTATFSDEDAMDSDSALDASPPTTYAGISMALGVEGDDKEAVQSERRAGVLIDDDPESAPHHYGFKRLYEQRRMAIENEEREARLSTPIFVCTLAFPGMPTILHIFEPRYRLMVRRCLESGNPRFGMVLPSRTHGGTEQYGTMLEIKSVQMLADGRSMLETVGSYRFRLLEKGSLDGYTVGRVERVDDISLDEEAELERAVLRRRAELERKKADERLRPTAQPMAVSNSAPVSVQQSAEAVARPEIARAESDALAIYRTEPSRADPAAATTTTANDATVTAATGATSSTATGATGATDATDATAATSSTATGATAATGAGGSVGRDVDAGGSEGGADEEEHGLLPFKPVPAEPSIEELTEICTSFIETLRSGSAPWLLSRLNHTYGPMPSADEVERLGYWMALVMPIDEHEKAKLLPIRSRRLRLCLVVHWIEQLRQSWWFNSGCTVS